MSSPRKITILGLGGTGCRITEFLSHQEGLEPRLVAIDSDQDDLARSGAPEASRILAGEPWRHGRGCGGNAQDGKNAVSHEREKIGRAIRDCELLMVVAGLGGGIGSGGASVVLSEARQHGIPVIFVVTEPFMIEGHGRRRLAESVLRDELVDLADAVISMPSDLLYCALDPDVTLADATRLAFAEFGRTVLSLSVLLLNGNLLSADFNDFVSILRKRHGHCSIGIGWAERGEEDFAAKVLERMLMSPFLGGGDRIEKADALIISLLGGPGLTLGEAKNLLERVGSRAGLHADSAIGAGVDPGMGDKVMLSVVAVKYEQCPVPAKPAEKLRQERRKGDPSLEREGAGQQIFDFNPGEKGAMERGTPVLWKGDELDVPTFQRRSLRIDKGE